MDNILCVQLFLQFCASDLKKIETLILSISDSIIEEPCGRRKKCLVCFCEEFIKGNFTWSCVLFYLH